MCKIKNTKHVVCLSEEKRFTLKIKLNKVKNDKYLTHYILLKVDMGVAHGDDIQYIFNDLWGEELEMSSSDKKFSRNIYSRMLADFAKTR